MVHFKDYFSSFVSSQKVHLFGNLFQGEQVDVGPWMKEDIDWKWDGWLKRRLHQVCVRHVKR